MCKWCSANILYNFDEMYTNTGLVSFCLFCKGSWPMQNLDILSKAKQQVHCWHIIKGYHSYKSTVSHVLPREQRLHFIPLYNQLEEWNMPNLRLFKFHWKVTAPAARGQRKYHMVGLYPSACSHKSGKEVFKWVHIKVQRALERQKQRPSGVVSDGRLGDGI